MTYGIAFTKASALLYASVERLKGATRVKAKKSSTRIDLPHYPSLPWEAVPDQTLTGGEPGLSLLPGALRREVWDRSPRFLCAQQPLLMWSSTQIKIVHQADHHGACVIADDVADTSSLAVLWQCGVKLISGAFLQESSQVIAQ